MLKLLHTANWQIGRVFSQFDEDDAAALFEARFQAVERLAALASQQAVQAVLVAGDVFDLQTVADKTLRRLGQALAGFAGPWLLLPGNHDAALASSVWQRAQLLGALPPNAWPCLTPEVRVVDGLGGHEGRFVLLPAPLTQRHTHQDLTSWFAEASVPAGAEGLPRIGLAHGCVQGLLPEGIDSANPIAAEAAARGRLDYLALGDWHGSRRIDERCWYAGTPETDRFRDNDSGQALLVGLDGPGGVPQVQPLPVGQYRWHSLAATIQVPSDVDGLLAGLAGLGRSDVLQLEVDGRCDLASHARLQAGVDAARARVRALVADAEALRLDPTDEDVAALQADGYVGEVLQALRERQREAAAEAGSDADAQLARDALLVLARELAGLDGGAGAAVAGAEGGR
jgi:DNA repair exonuclease SbcCD nuclease subunit